MEAYLLGLLRGEVRASVDGIGRGREVGAGELGSGVSVAWTRVSSGVEDEEELFTGQNVRAVVQRQDACPNDASNRERDGTRRASPAAKYS